MFVSDQQRRTEMEGNMKIDNIIDYLYSQLNNDEFEKDILKYGLEVLIYNVFTLSILILLTILFKNYLFGLIFIPVFCCLRITIGGFHCKTVYACTLLMITIYSIISLLSRIPFYHEILYIIALPLAVLLLLIPQCEENTVKLSKHYIVYKYVLFVLFVVTYFSSYKTIYFIPIFSSLLVVMIMYLMRIISISINT